MNYTADWLRREIVNPAIGTIATTGQELWEWALPGRLQTGIILFMDGQNLLFITPTLSIPLSELTFRFSRSSGPGGQHVNRSETRVELVFDVAHSPSLDEAQREQLLNRLSHLVDQEGLLHLTASESRSQYQNRERVQVRFQKLLQAAFKPRKRRRPTRPTRSSVERRLEDKRRRSASKRERRRKDW